MSEKISPEREAALNALLEEKIQERDDVTEEWIDGYISYDAAVEMSRMLSDEIRDLIQILNP